MQQWEEERRGSDKIQEPMIQGEEEGRADKIQEPLIQREEDGIEGRGSDTAEYHPGQSQLTTFKNH